MKASLLKSLNPFLKLKGVFRGLGTPVPSNFLTTLQGSKFRGAANVVALLFYTPIYNKV